MSEAVEIPRFVKVRTYVEARANSIAELLQAVDNQKLVSGEVTKGPRTAAQRLPRHMRRRAMAYEVRRFPRGMRTFAAPYLVSSKHRKKPPSRFARRKPTNLLQDYERRKLKAKWLETHIWHAKRFHMTQRWGFKVAERNFQRGFRASLRDSLKHCTVRDRSYLCCFNIRHADQQKIIEKVAAICSPCTGPTFACKSALNGQVEITVLLYHSNSYPNRFIAPARASWSFQKESNLFCLAVWVHPACKEEVFKVLKDLFSLGEKNSEIEDGHTKFAHEISYHPDGEFEVSELNMALNRFSLYGPNSLRVIKEAFLLADSDVSFKNNHEEWSELVAQSSPSQLLDGSIFSLLIEDPRVLTTKKQFKPLPKTDFVLPASLEAKPQSQIWSESIRLAARKKRMTPSDFEKLNGSMIGGVKTTAAKIPIWVVVRNDLRALTGAEVIVPEGFGKDLWISLQWSGAHSSGEKDNVAAHFESTAPHFPRDAVDCESARAFESEVHRELEIRQDRRPHNRRVSFWGKLSVKFPFSFEWIKLVGEWNDPNDTGCESAIVLRDVQLLRSVDEWVRTSRNFPDLNKKNLLIPIRLDLIARGRPRRFALICIPTEHDLCKYKTNIKFCLEQPSRTEETTSTSDYNSSSSKIDETPKKDLSDFVSLDLSALEKPISLQAIFGGEKVGPTLKRRRANQLKRAAAKNRKLEKASQLQRNDEVRKSQNEASYVESASRSIIGRVLSGEQSMTEGKGIAFGLIPFNALLKVVGNQDGRTVVLVRNATSKYYHPAYISVVTKQCQI